MVGIHRKNVAAHRHDDDVSPEDGAFPLQCAFFLLSQGYGGAPVKLVMRRMVLSAGEAGDALPHRARASGISALDHATRSIE